MELVAFLIGGGFIAALVLLPPFRYAVGAALDLGLKLIWWVLIVGFCVFLSMLGGQQ